MYTPLEWFTNTTDYDYLFEFLQGLALIEDFDNSDLCIEALIAFYDDTTQFINNVTIENNHIVNEDLRYMYPLLNFTKMIGSEFAEAWPYCYDFVFVEQYDYWVALYSAMNNNFNTMLISFLFTQMGNAKDFKTAIDKITENEEN